MATYMIDYENVKTGGLNGISRLTAEDRVIIFYSENANRLTFDLHRRLMECPAKIEYREVTVGGHNALDFQLVTYLGYLIAQDPTGQYLIISYDRGFEYVVNFWRKDGLCIGLLPYLKDPSYALSKVVRGEICKAEPEEAKEAPAEEPSEEPAEEPVVEFVSAEEEAPAEEMPAEVPAEETPAEVPAEAPVEVPVEVPAEAPVEVPVEEAPAEVPAEKPVKKAPAKKKSSPKKPKVELKPAEEPKAEEPKEAPKAEEPKEAPKPKAKAAPKAKAEHKTEKSASNLPAVEELRALLGDLVADDPEARFVRSALEKYKTKLGLNNALVKNFGNQRAGEIYQKVKPLMAGKKD